ncbi:MAG: 5-formyltetrahydrofolate cyclo-ligase [Pseudomonas sp.]
MIPTSRPALRKQLRKARNTLTPAQQRQASLALARHLAHHPLFIRSRHVAFYLANDGEIDPAAAMRRAQRRGKSCYLPVLSRWPATQMRFQRLEKSQRWRKNRFGITEPVPNPRRQVKTWRLQLILMPLVGFDRNGNRLGMGGGFYDRALAYLRRRSRWQSPQLLGVAHQCQEVKQLSSAAWDIRLNGIVSDQGSQMFLPRQ